MKNLKLSTAMSVLLGVMLSGHAAYAQTLVLAIFMGGMALGSWLVSRFTHRIKSLLLGYAMAEAAIGLMALLFHRVFVAATAFSGPAASGRTSSATDASSDDGSLVTATV